MLSHVPSNASNRLQQAKSSSTRTSHYVPIEPSHIDPASSRHHAITAASVALERASERALALQEIRELGQQHLPNSSSSVENQQRLGKKHSIRFTGPTARPTIDRPLTRRVAEDSIANLEPQPIALQAPQSLDEYAARWPENYLIGLPVPGEDYPGTRVSSIPSSYRKLRKAKSMFNPRSHRSVILTNGAPRKLLHNNQQFTRSPGPRLHRSFSFLRGDSDNITLGTEQVVFQEPAVQIARDEYLRRLDDQTLKEQSPFLVLDKRRKPNKAFRKTVRTSSTNSCDGAITSSTPQLTEPPDRKGFGYKARSLSLSLKNKLKRVFHRPSETESVLPVQQVDASRPHFGDYMSTSTGVDQQYHHIPSPDGEILHRARSRESLFRDLPALLSKSSHPGSIRSVKTNEEIANNKSRVTSWTNSTALNTMTSNQLMEKKRLSIIQENGGPYQPSSSTRQYGDLSDIFRVPTSNSNRDRPINTNSQEIYSALQKRINGNKRTAQPQESHLRTENGEGGVTVNSSGSGRASSRKGDLSSSRESLSQSHDMRVPGSVIFQPSTTTTTDIFGLQKEHYLDQEQRLDSAVHEGLTPQQIAERNEIGNPSPKRPLREVKSTFFPASMRIERSNTSPYRRTMNMSSEGENIVDTEEKGLGYMNSTEFPIRRLLPNRAGVRSAIETESIYSRTSSGNTPRPKSSISLAMSTECDEPGTAVIITTRPMKHDQFLSPMRLRPSYLTKQNRDWQDWMASEAVQPENPGEENKRASDARVIKEHSHRRESPQIDEDDFQGGRFQTFKDAPKRPLVLLQENSNTRPILRRQSSRTMVDRFPLLEMSQPAQSTVAERTPSTPKGPCATPPSKWPLAGLGKEASGRRSNMSAGLPLKTSYTSLKSHGSSSMLRQSQVMDSENTESHASGSPRPVAARGLTQIKQMHKAQSRHSPERLARLRRKQSGISLAPEGPVQRGPDAENIRPLQGNGIVQGTTLETTPNGNDKDTNDKNSAETPTAGGRNIVDIFLSSRRKQMLMNEETAVDPAFL